MKYTNHRYMTKVFHFLQKKLGITAEYSTFFNGSIKDQCVASSMEAAIHLGPDYLAKLEVYKNTKFEEIQSLFNITQKTILEHSEEISDCEYH